MPVLPPVVARLLDGLDYSEATRDDIERAMLDGAALWVAVPDSGRGVPMVADPRDTADDVLREYCVSPDGAYVHPPDGWAAYRLGTVADIAGLVADLAGMVATREDDDREDEEDRA